MKVAIVCDSFKESLSASEVAREIEAGFREIFPDAHYIRRPMADGGEGTALVLAEATGGRIVSRTVSGPMGTPVEARFAISGDGRTAVIELAEAAGLALVPISQRNPLLATTYGVGELMHAALDEGCRHIVLALGGSATNDGGLGLAQALGVVVTDEHGMPLPHGGGSLAKAVDIDISAMDSRLHACRIELACDVVNPLIGPNGASAVFGPQKGATPEMVVRLDKGLAQYGALLERIAGSEFVTLPGIGAAGGAGLSVVAFMGAHLRPGAEIVAEALGLEALLEGVDLVITGEGRIDGQTIHGKAPVAVARLARQRGIPVVAIAGSLGEGVEKTYRHGITAAFSVLDRPCTLEDALAEAAPNLRRTARNVAALMQISHEGIGRQEAPE